MKTELTMLERATDAVESAYDKAMGWDFEEIARAVIASLKEPSDMVCASGADAAGNRMSDGEAFIAFNAMIDEILEEGKT